MQSSKAQSSQRHSIQSIITRQVLTLATSVTRIWSGKRVEKKGQRSIGFFFSSSLLHTWRLETDKSEDSDVRPVSKILCKLE